MPVALVATRLLRSQIFGIEVRTDLWLPIGRVKRRTAQEAHSRAQRPRFH